MPKKSAKKTPKPPSSSEYGAKQITVLEGLDPVRKRPGMYIGTTGPAGLHHLIWECLDNSIDEAMGGYADDIRIRLLPGNKVEVRDNGRGIPVDLHPQFKVSALELVMTKLHAGGKFGGGGYKVSGGLHGVGVSVVNALSTWMKAEVRRDGAAWVQEYKIGKPAYKVKKIGASRDHGTSVTFEPDASIFETTEFDWQTVLDHVRQQAYLTKGVKITVQDARNAQEPLTHVFYFEGGVASYVKHINHAKHPKHENVFYVQKAAEKIDVEVALQYTEEFKESVFSFANNILNPGGGTHMIGFRTALTRVLNGYARGKNYLKEKDENLTGEDVREGLTAVISVKVSEPQFEGQTKDKLGNPEVRTAVEAVFGDAFATFLEEHPRDAEQILEKCVLAAQARAAARAARDTVLRKGMLEGLTLPGKLADCGSRDPKESELFLVEGDSAGGCFSGDTKVALTDGRSLSFKELIEEQQRGIQNYCYTLDGGGHVAIAPIENVRRTKQNAEILKVVLDTSEEIICTPDHKFRLTDGSYVAARKLTTTMSLAPLHRQISKIGKCITIKGYELVYDATDKRWIFTHLLSDAYNMKRGAYAMEQGSHRHHIDFNKRNNNPDNIVRVSKEAHLPFHRLFAETHLRTPEVLEKLQKIRKSPQFRDKIRKKMLAMRDELSQRAKKQWGNPDLRTWRQQKTREQWTLAFREKRRAALSDTYYYKTIAFAKQLLERTASLSSAAFNSERIQKKDKNILSLETFALRYFGGDPDALFTAIKNYNHKIKAIIPLSGRVDVYDLEVPGTHNFALAAGVFVHNSSKQGRDRRTQAILPLRGKILNVERARIDKMLQNAEIRSLIIALGTNFGEQFDIAGLRYDKIIIATDADTDGSHIRTLLLTLFYRYFPEIIKQGHMYIAQPPLYKVQVGKEVRYAHSDEEKDQTIKEMTAGKKSPKQSSLRSDATGQAELKKQKAGEDVAGGEEAGLERKANIQRYKGLGEMNPEELWETTMNPANRILKQVTIEDAGKADEIFDILMGSEVAPRKRFIQTHAKTVKNLDI